VQLPNTRISDKFFLFLAICAALFALVMHAGIAQTNLPRHAWKAAADHIRSQFQPGDAIALLPPWALKGAEPLHDKPVLLSPTIVLDDLSRYTRLWVLAAPRLGKWWFQHAFKSTIKQLDRRYWRQKKWVFAWYKDPKTGRQRFGLRNDGKGFRRLEVYLFRLPPARPMLYDFLAKRHLRQAEVSLDTPPSRTRQGRCRASAGQVTWLRRWQENPGWFLGRGHYFFGRLIQEIHNTPKDCLYAQPQACRVLKVRYRNVPLQGTMSIEHGFTTPAPGKVTGTVPPTGSDVQLSIWAENKKLKTITVSNRQVWRKTLLDLSKFTWSHKRGSVTFQIQTPNRQSQRVGYCFRATLRKR
jgi:hypothetical protein